MIEERFEEVKEYFTSFLPRGVHFLIALARALVIIVAGFRLIKFITGEIKKSMLKKGAEPGVVSFLISAIKLLLQIFVVVVAAQVLGLETSSVVALVGSAGLAIGLALQGSLANFAGGVLILLMKPFCVGDYIVVGDVEGWVKKIDIVYTTLRTRDGQAVVLPNGKLADSNIVNASKEGKRRINFAVLVDYRMDLKQVRKSLLEVMEQQEARIEDMPMEVAVGDLADSGVRIQLYMWVLPDVYWAVRERLAEAVKEKFDEDGIVIPFNQLDVTIKNNEK